MNMNIKKSTLLFLLCVLAGTVFADPEQPLNPEIRELQNARTPGQNTENSEVQNAQSQKQDIVLQQLTFFQKFRNFLWTYSEKFFAFVGIVAGIYYLNQPNKSVVYAEDKDENNAAVIENLRNFDNSVTAAVEGNVQGPFVNLDDASSEAQALEKAAREYVDAARNLREAQAKFKPGIAAQQQNLGTLQALVNAKKSIYQSKLISYAKSKRIKVENNNVDALRTLLDAGRRR